jgi:hypothetical protein
MANVLGCTLTNLKGNGVMIGCKQYMRLRCNKRKLVTIYEEIKMIAGRRIDRHQQEDSLSKETVTSEGIGLDLSISISAAGADSLAGIHLNRALDAATSNPNGCSRGASN